MLIPWQPVPGASSRRTVSYALSVGNKQLIHWLRSRCAIACSVLSVCSLHELNIGNHSNFQAHMILWEMLTFLRMKIESYNLSQSISSHIAKRKKISPASDGFHQLIIYFLEKAESPADQLNLHQKMFDFAFSFSLIGNLSIIDFALVIIRWWENSATPGRGDVQEGEEGFASSQKSFTVMRRRENQDIRVAE